MVAKCSVPVFLLLVVALGATGCATFNSAKVTYHPTLIGDELTALHRAMESGAITEEEFEAAKSRVLEQEPGTFHVDIDGE